MPLIPSAFDDEHGLNPWLKRLSPLLVLAMIPVLVFYQQFLIDLHSRTIKQPPPEIARIEEPEEPGLDEASISSKYVVKRLVFARTEGRNADPDSLQEFVDFLDLRSRTRVDRLRAAIVAGELLGPEVAANRIDILRAETTPDSDFHKETSILLDWYQSHVKKKDPKVDAAGIEWIVARHGWFGDLAFSLGKPLSDTRRWEVASGYERIESLSFAMGTVAVLGWLGGGMATVVLLIMAFGRRLHLAAEPPSAPTHVYFETFAVFCLLFLLVLTVGVFTIGEKGTWVIVIGQAALWCSMLAMTWPRLRGLSGMEIADDMGFNKGEGWLKEIGVGVMVFGITLLAEAGLALVLGFFTSGAPEEPIGVPMFESPVATTWFLLVLDAMSSCIWAPVLEEVMFRGTLMTALRSKMGVVAAAACTAVVFGIYHPYDITGIISVALGGFIYGLVRGWRGSLIAPIVAHFLWNAFSTTASLGTLVLLD